jgi:hypothetical protein
LRSHRDGQEGVRQYRQGDVPVPAVIAADEEAGLLSCWPEVDALIRSTDIAMT